MTVYERWLAYRALALEEGRQSTLEQIRRVFKKDVIPPLRRMTIHEITRHHLLEVVERIEKRGSLSVAEKACTWFRQLFGYAMVIVPEMENNPARDLHVVAVPLPPVQHNPFLRMEEMPSFLRILRTYQGRQVTQLAIRLLLLTGVRTGELRLPAAGHLGQLLRDARSSLTVADAIAAPVPMYRSRATPLNWAELAPAAAQQGC